MGEVIEGVFHKQANWGAFVEIAPAPAGPQAKITGFWGTDEMEVAERCRAYAKALSLLSAELARTAAEVEPSHG